jgi:RNA polymerase sigma factor (sigma-70 family)
MAVTEAGARAARELDDLYREYVGDVYRYSYAVLGNHADAEDVTQTTFVNVLRALERGERPRTPANWLIAIAHNIIRQRWRQENVRPSEVELVADVAALQPDDTQPPLAEVVRALQRIPPTQREALVMRELEGRSYKEIAEILGTTTGALETLLFRARRSLAEEMDNLVTCDRAELAISRRLDRRLGRKERRRLAEHLRECPACAAFAAGQQRHRTAMRGLAVLPLPASLVLWKGAPTASAAVGLPAIGLGAGAAVGTGATVGAGAAASGTVGGLALGGIAVKAAAVVAAVGVAGGVSYEGVKIVGGKSAEPPPRAATTAVAQASSASALSKNRVIPGRAKASAERASKAAAAKRAAAVKKAAAKKSIAAKKKNVAANSKKSTAAKENNAAKKAAVATTRAQSPRASGKSTGAAKAPKPKPTPAQAADRALRSQPATKSTATSSGAKTSSKVPAGGKPAAKQTRPENATAGSSKPKPAAGKKDQTG